MLFDSSFIHVRAIWWGWSFSFVFKESWLKEWACERSCMCLIHNPHRSYVFRFFFFPAVYIRSHRRFKVSLWLLLLVNILVYWVKMAINLVCCGCSVRSRRMSSGWSSWLYHIIWLIFPITPRGRDVASVPCILVSVIKFTSKFHRQVSCQHDLPYWLMFCCILVLQTSTAGFV